MGDLNLIVLTTNSKDGAVQALDVAKRLDRDGWIELMDYVVLTKDKKGHGTKREMDDEFSEKAAAATVGVAGGVIGASVGGPAGAVAGVAAGALAGAGSVRLMEKIVTDTELKGFPQGLEPDSSVLAVVVEERYAERLDEELQKLGRTARRELKRAEREAEFDPICSGRKTRYGPFRMTFKHSWRRFRLPQEPKKTRLPQIWPPSGLNWKPGVKNWKITLRR